MTTWHVMFMDKIKTIGPTTIFLHTCFTFIYMYIQEIFFKLQLSEKNVHIIIKLKNYSSSGHLMRKQCNRLILTTCTKNFDNGMYWLSLLECVKTKRDWFQSAAQLVVLEISILIENWSRVSVSWKFENSKEKKIHTISTQILWKSKSLHSNMISFKYIFGNVALDFQCNFLPISNAKRAFSPF